MEQKKGRRKSVAYEEFHSGEQTRRQSVPKGRVCIDGIPEAAGDEYKEEITMKPTTFYGCVGNLVFKNEFQAVLYNYTESRTFKGFIMAIIFINTIMLIAQTWPTVLVRTVWYFAALDNIFLGIYVMEIVLKIYVWRSPYFKEGWNILDFIIVLFNIVDFMLPLILSNVAGFNGVAIFRLLRIFRAVKAIRALRFLRTIRLLANLQVIMTTLLQSIRSIGAIVTLIGLTMYLFAVIGRGLYAEVDENHFGSLFNSIFTLFQLLTLDDWFDIYDTAAKKGHSNIILFLLLYIVVEYFIFLNLFVAVLVDNFQLSLEAANETAKQKKLLLMESDDEDDNVPNDAASVSSMSSDLSAEKNKLKKKSLEELYKHLPEKEIETLRRYFHLMASMEYSHMMLDRQQRVLDMMVDLCVANPDEI